MADFKIKKVDSLPDTLAENAMILYDGELWIGNSDNEPWPAKGYKEIIYEYSATDSGYSSNPSKIHGNMSILSFGFDGTPGSPTIVLDEPFTNVDNFFVIPLDLVDDSLGRIIGNKGDDNGNIEINHTVPTSSGQPFTYTYKIIVYSS